MSNVAGESFGKYTLEKVLGRGGMATVYLATEKGPSGFEKQLCLKKILPHLAEEEEFVGMFLDEARTAARLSHPNLVQIFGLGEENGVHYIVMEYVNGVSLARVIRALAEQGNLAPVPIVASMISKVASALDYAHRFCDEKGEPLNLVHRDVSPDNILISRDGAVKLIDFGIAKASTNENKTVSGAVKGKFRFMSPEQIRGQSLDGRSDLFSLGLVLYELMTGTQAFDGGGGLGTVNAILAEEPRPLDSLHDRIPKDLHDLVMSLLAKDREERPKDCFELEKSLEEFMRASGELVSQRDLGEWVASLLGEGTKPAAQAGVSVLTGFEETLPGAHLDLLEEGDETVQAPLPEEGIISSMVESMNSEVSEDSHGLDEGVPDEVVDFSAAPSSTRVLWATAFVVLTLCTVFLWPEGKEESVGGSETADRALQTNQENVQKASVEVVPGSDRKEEKGGKKEEEPAREAQEKTPMKAPEARPSQPLSEQGGETGLAKAEKAPSLLPVKLDWSQLPPNTKVFLDGGSRGKTPLKVMVLKRRAGTALVIELELPSGEKRKLRRVVGAKGNHFIIK